MALAAGTKLGQYEVREAIGAGGMGEVYRATDTKLKRDEAVDVATLPTFTPGRPKVAFEGQYEPDPTGGQRPNYDVSPDGQRFLMLKPVESQASAPTQINVVLNWFEELKQKVPPSK